MPEMSKPPAQTKGQMLLAFKPAPPAASGSDRSATDDIATDQHRINNLIDEITTEPDVQKLIEEGHVADGAHTMYTNNAYTEKITAHGRYSGVAINLFFLRLKGSCMKWAKANYKDAERHGDMQFGVDSLVEIRCHRCIYLFGDGPQLCHSLSLSLHLFRSLLSLSLSLYLCLSLYLSRSSSVSVRLTLSLCRTGTSFPN